MDLPSILPDILGTFLLHFLHLKSTKLTEKQLTKRAIISLKYNSFASNKLFHEAKELNMQYFKLWKIVPPAQRRELFVKAILVHLVCVLIVNKLY